MPTEVASIRREHIETLLVRLQGLHSVSTAANRYRNLRQLFRWLEEEGEVPASPMDRMRPPKVNEKELPVIPADDLRALVEACQGQSFDARRDTALILTFWTPALDSRRCPASPSMTSTCIDRG